MAYLIKGNKKKKLVFYVKEYKIYSYQSTTQIQIHF